ncbi:MAG: clostripain-related cysteine peptidase [Pseudomonadota bacterium]
MGTMKQEKKWTVMVYLAGDNNLDGPGIVDLKEMKSVGSTEAVNIIAQFDREGNKGESRRYFLRKGGTLDADAVANLGETNTGDPKVLQEFIAWGMGEYPAERYMVVIWNHGAGWDDTNVYRMVRDGLKMDVSRKAGIVAKAAGESQGVVANRHIRRITARPLSRALFGASIEMALKTRAIAFDDQARDFIDNQELKKVLAAAKKKLKRKIDILGMDACLMNMAEVAYQVKGSVAFTVGSQEVEPGDGWPYDKILAQLVKKPDMQPRELARLIVDDYLASYKAGDGVTQSALDLEKVDTIAGACDGLAKVLIENLPDKEVRAALLAARNQVQSFENPDYVDLVDLAQLIRQQITKAAIALACTGVIDAVSGGFVAKSGFKGSTMAHAQGVSIYFPVKGISPLYAKLDFAKKTAWDELIRKFQEANTVKRI